MALVESPRHFNRNVESSAFASEGYHYSLTTNLRQKTDISSGCKDNISKNYQQVLSSSPTVFHKKTQARHVPQSVSPSKLYATSNQQAETFTAFLGTLSANRKHQLEKITHIPAEKKAGFYSPNYSSFGNYQNLKKKNFKHYPYSLADQYSEHPFSLSDCLESARELYNESRPVQQNSSTPSYARPTSTSRSPTPSSSARLTFTKSESSMSIPPTPRSTIPRPSSSRPQSSRLGNKSATLSSTKTSSTFVTTFSNSSSHKSTVKLLRNLHDHKEFEKEILAEEKEQRKIERIHEQHRKTDLFNPDKQMREIDDFELRIGLKKKKQ
ncbi:predicted protein [Naegleria gruberi]|uniref:Predicted protein n=1 Tax=Naegleria gruberi TaxID=5762 RepID=D2VPA6_NAEGR|nr:uncharacterized protein NAEGRDRAFT_80731 [Naegleria gruberi]EFC41399.1 predicted protein [Naegleria gruberi]|eukprot:XP_002674143.1 predicted protein [Naegleria gruberi strain NEG-M]